MELTPDEAVRMSLLFSEQNRNPQQVLSLVSNNLKTTKGVVGGAHLVIVDSMLFGSATKASDGPMVLYVVSNGSDQGYTIVNKDNRLAPIVGYSDSGDYNTEARNPAVNIILRNVVAYQAHLLDSLEGLRGDQVYNDLQNKLGITQGPATRIYDDDGPPDNRPTVPWDRYEVVEEASWQTQDYVDGPLLETKWGQMDPYNSLLPTNCPVGCTATSAAQIMAYYKYPKYSPITGQEYLWNSYPTQTYNWAADLKYNIGNLMIDLGSRNCLNMVYLAITNPFTSEIIYPGSFPGSLNCTNTPRTFEIFGYYGGAHRRYSYEAIVPDISAKRPVHICGKESLVKGWHTWVLDGATHYSNWRRTATKFYYQGSLVHTIYQDYIWSAAAYVHHNFGWSGLDNGWYSSGSMYWEFDTDVEIITGIRPR